jgi:hypothetical protein
VDLETKLPLDNYPLPQQQVTVDAGEGCEVD